jgi:hypothetical protein
MSIVLAATGALGIAGGFAAVVIAKRFPSRGSALQLWGGRLVISGLALAGLSIYLI